jgi:hypothetical protein
VIDGRPAFDLLAIHLFEEKFFEKLIDERRVDARYTGRRSSGPVRPKDIGRRAR